MNLKALVALIGAFFETLFRTTQKAFNKLPKEQQDAIIQGVNLSQLIKENYDRGEAYLVKKVSLELKISEDVARGLILHVLNSVGINVTDIKIGLPAFVNRMQNTTTDDGHNSLFEAIAKIGASWLATGALNWVTLGLGVVEYAYQRYVKNIK